MLSVLRVATASRRCVLGLKLGGGVGGGGGATRSNGVGFIGGSVDEKE